MKVKWPEAGAAVYMAKKIPFYDGQTPVADYLVMFHMAAGLNGWNYERQGMGLATNLVGSAQAVL